MRNVADVVGRPDRQRLPLLGRRGRGALALGAAVVVVAGSWLWTGLHPTVVSEGLLEVRGLPGGGSDAWARGPTGGRMVLEVRNDGDLPFTAHGARSPVPVEGVIPLHDDGRPDLEAVTASLAVAPGERALLLLGGGLLPAYCQGLEERGQAREVVVTVRTLGLPATRRLTLPRPVQVAPPSPPCR